MPAFESPVITLRSVPEPLVVERSSVWRASRGAHLYRSRFGGPSGLLYIGIKTIIALPTHLHRKKEPRHRVLFITSQLLSVLRALVEDHSHCWHNYAYPPLPILSDLSTIVNFSALSAPYSNQPCGIPSHRGFPKSTRASASPICSKRRYL